MFALLWHKLTSFFGKVDRKSRREILHEQLETLKFIRKMRALRPHEDDQGASIIQELAQITEDDVRYGGLP